MFFISNFQAKINVISIKYKLMVFLNYNLRKIFIVLTGIILLNFLNSCGIWDPADARKVSPNVNDRVQKSLKEGREPPQPQSKKGDVIKTNGQDTILRIPKRNIDDRKFIKSIGSNIMKLQFDAEKMPIKDRDNSIINQLKDMEKSGAI